MPGRRHRIRLIAATALSLAAAAVTAGPALGACGVSSPSAIASALHLSSAAEIPFLSTPGPFWSVETDCTVVAWSGKRPVGKAQVQAAIAAGTYAVVSISTWVPTVGLFLPGAQEKGFHETLTSIQSRARLQLVKGLHGSTFKPAGRGALAKGWKGAGKTFREARAVWWRKASLRIITIDLRASRKAPATAGLGRIAAILVPAFGL